ncbi:MAG TPA: hypothetical protein VHE13_12115 [Opitutus sp.]|nr:hypothetical protein [Opitutus sp.]
MLDTLIRKGILTADEAAQIQTEAATSAKAAAASKSQTRVSGKLYVDFSDISAVNAAGAKVSPSGDGLDVKRFYFGVTHQFNDVWSANINTDSSYSSASGATNLFIKTAYVQAKISPELTLQAGSANMPWIPFVEDLYTFRYIEQTMVDRLHFGNSADWGLHAYGKSGIVSYNVAAVNGGGYKNPTRTKTVDYAGRVSVEPITGLTFAGGFYTGRLGKDSYGSPSTREATRYDLLAAYSAGRFRVGTEYFWESDWGYTASPQSDSSDGYSLFGRATISGPFSAFARYDNVKTSKKLHPDMRDKYFNAGVEWHAFSGVDLALVYKRDRIDNPASASQVAKYDEFGVFSQVAF